MHKDHDPTGMAELRRRRDQLKREAELLEKEVERLRALTDPNFAFRRVRRRALWVIPLLYLAIQAHLYMGPWSFVRIFFP